MKKSIFSIPLKRNKSAKKEAIKGFDDFEIRLGDILRGERATLGKTLIDVQHELKIQSEYIIAIENADPDAFESQGFIAGYVRSYALYLALNPDDVFEAFCDESGFSTTRTLTKTKAPHSKKTMPRYAVTLSRKNKQKLPFEVSRTPYIPQERDFFSELNSGALGYICILFALIFGLGYGAWTVIEQVQRVQFSPIERTPSILTHIQQGQPNSAATDQLSAGGNVTTSNLDSLYRPQALDAPILTPRDSAIATLDPNVVGFYKNAAIIMPQGQFTPAQANPAIQTKQINASKQDVQVNIEPKSVQLVAVRPAWVRVRAEDKSVLFEGIMEPGDRFALSESEASSTLRIGESSAVYFVVNDRYYGPVGPRGQVTSNVALSAHSIAETYTTADPSQDQALETILNVASLRN